MIAWEETPGAEETRETKLLKRYRERFIKALANEQVVIDPVRFRHPSPVIYRGILVFGCVQLGDRSERY